MTRPTPPAPAQRAAGPGSCAGQRRRRHAWHGPGHPATQDLTRRPHLQRARPKPCPAVAAPRTRHCPRPGRGPPTETIAITQGHLPHNAEPPLQRRIFASQAPFGRDATSAQIAPIWTVRVAIGLERTSALGSGAADTPAGRTFRRQRLCRCLDPGTLGCLAASLLAGRELSFGSGRPVPRRWFPISPAVRDPPVQNLAACQVRPASGVRSSWWRPGIPGWLITTQPAVGLT